MLAWCLSENLMRMFIQPDSVVLLLHPMMCTFLPIQKLFQLVPVSQFPWIWHRLVVVVV